MKSDELSKNVLLSLYEKLEEIRKFELKAVELYSAGEMPGFIHSSLGQEAIPVGVITNLKEDDYIASNHRGHGHAIAKGTSLNSMMAELYAKKDGCNKGKGGSMHMMDRSKNILGANGIVGASIPLATGAGLASQLLETEQVTVCFFGDGASNIGFFHESLNLAAIWKLPVLFVCENNEYGMFASVKDVNSVKNISDRAAAYGIESFTVDGNDVLAVYEAAKEAVDLCRAGKGPILFEAKTYRWLGHFVGDPGNYRPKGEAESWKKENKEPIARFEKVLLDDERISESDLEKIKKVAAARIDAAIEFGRNSDPLDPSSALEDIYKEGIL